MFVSTCRTSTLTPGSTPPLASSTVPSMTPVVICDWPIAGAANVKVRIAIANACRRRIVNLRCEALILCDLAVPPQGRSLVAVLLSDHESVQNPADDAHEQRAEDRP